MLDTVGHQKWTYFSALCWLYGKRLYKERGYPIGLISSTYADSGIEAWSSPEVLDSCGIKPEEFGYLFCVYHLVCLYVEILSRKYRINFRVKQ
jgi:hypothetical protein